MFAKRTVVVRDDGSCNALDTCYLGDVPFFQWFARMEHYVFNDVDENGQWDAGEGFRSLIEISTCVSVMAQFIRQ
ncbi:MAG: hypothetical protein R3E89_16355 [Thiolinea sp.]